MLEAKRDNNKFMDCVIVDNARFIVLEDAHFKHLREIPFPYVEVIRLKEFMDLLQSE